MKKNRPFFSVIVPCCDVGSYVRECFASLTTQDFADWECIAVVETSKDDTERVVRELAAKDPRFSVIVEGRSGSPATPRNTGLGLACGDYVVFLDGDDWLEGDALGTLARMIAETPGADLYPCAVTEIVESETGERTFKAVIDCYPEDAPKRLTGREAIQCIDAHPERENPMAVLTVCRRAFLERWNLRFMPGLVHEDVEFAPRALYRAESVVPLHYAYYVYRMRSGSIMAGQAVTNVRFEHQARVLASLFRFHSEVSSEPDFDRAFSPIWTRNWFSKVFFFFFAEKYVKNVPRTRRLSALRDILFADGFGDFDFALSLCSRPKRVAGAFVRFGVRTGLLWLADVFFVRFYFPLCYRRAGRGAAGKA